MNRVVSSSALGTIKKILIIQYKPFGDVLLNTGYLPALRKKFPDAQIDYLVQKPYTTLLENNPSLDNLVFMKKRNKKLLTYMRDRFDLIRKIRNEGYDVIIDQARGPGASQMVLFSGAKYRLGWHKTKKWSWFKGYNWVYNYRRVKNHDIYSARAKFGVLEPLGIEEIPHNTYYHILNESQEYITDWLDKQNISGKKILVFSPVTPIRSRQWDLKLFAEVADIMVGKHGFVVVLLWGPGEKQKVEQMKSFMKQSSFIAPDSTFNEAGALLKEATLYIGNNGGIHHLSVAVGTPTITVFGPNTSPLKWTAWHNPIHRYVKNDSRKVYLDGTFAVSPEMVITEFKKMTGNLGGRFSAYNPS